MRWRSFAVLSVTFFMLLLDFSIVNVAAYVCELAVAMLSKLLSKLDKALDLFKPAGFMSAQRRQIMNLGIGSEFGKFETASPILGGMHQFASHAAAASGRLDVPTFDVRDRR